MWANFITEDGNNDRVTDTPSYIEGRKHTGGYFACVALNMLNRNMMLSAEPEDADKLKRGHFGNALMYAAIVLQVSYHLII